MKAREISSLWTPLTKVLPLVFLATFGTILFSMFALPNTWQCYRNAQSVVCSPFSKEDGLSTDFGKPLTKDEKQKAFFAQRETILIVFLVFFAVTSYRASLVQRVQIQDNYLLISDYIRTIRLPARNIQDVRVGSFPQKTIILTFTEPTIFGSKVKFVAQSGMLSYRSQETVEELLLLKELSQKEIETKKSRDQNLET